MTAGELCAEFLLIALTSESWDEIADRAAAVVAGEGLMPEVEAYLAAH